MLHVTRTSHEHRKPFMQFNSYLSQAQPEQKLKENLDNPVSPREGFFLVSQPGQTQHNMLIKFMNVKEYCSYLNPY